ncbi:MAG: ribonuclease H-like domain-containing protein [Patescibacteria group bacterium]
MALVFDIETIGEEWENIDIQTQENLTRWIKREAGEEDGKYNAMLSDLKEGLGFSPLTGEIVAIGVYDTIKNKGVVYFSAPKAEIKEWNSGNFIFKQRDEAQMLYAFWQGVRNYKETISFNGRSFDVPFMLIRSAVCQVKPTVNLMSNRYLGSQYGVKHIDLLDQLSFYGAVRRKGNLHLYCRALGIESPKISGVTGDDVGLLFKNGEYKKIAEYNSRDLIATAKLYKAWQEYIQPNI